MNTKYENVTVDCKANFYFDGKVISHAFTFADGSRKTMGIIFPGTYAFDTAVPELMEIHGGSCRVKLPGSNVWETYAAGTAFNVPANANFEIAVDDGPAEYICSYG